MNIIYTNIIIYEVQYIISLINIKIKKIEQSNSIDNKSIFKIINNDITSGKWNDWKNFNGMKNIIL